MSKNQQLSQRPLAELHTHSVYSDGQHTVPELIEMCVEHGIKMWSLTDHDTCEGCIEAAPLAEQHGIEFIPGVEVSARQGCSVHVLGYGVDPLHTESRAFFAERKHERDTRMARMIQASCEHGMSVTMEQVRAFAADGNLARPHLARALVDLGYVDSVQGAFDEWLAEGKPLYKAAPSLTVPEAIELIHSAGGIAVLAHPAHYGLDDEIPRWVNAGLDGIEVSHPRHGESDVERLTAIADRFGLLKTASSDFHGEAVAPKRLWGVTSVRDTWLDALRERIG